ncbi:transcriptional regulator AryK [Staphylococcus americanisciuri]|uniref:Helix-turn-helix domain-containing protein n=1 Tax=Staphylococcus americanisciuri TaxID=2973940 RepID=A0ABT2F0C8_9STAP|nr:helix-turn-helix domain-containing protein [Staphylococcus americanisciuri]MCS4485792.1 helix-turn-helix domain-containing protein [Staphylococcus americanisciuri]
MKNLYTIELDHPNDEQIKLNDGLKIILVLKGTIQILKNQEKQSYKAGELFLINHRETYRFVPNEGVLYIAIQFKVHYLQNYIYDAAHKYFVLEKETLQEVIYKQMVNAIANIGIVHIRQGAFHRLYIEQKLMDLMFILVRYLSTKQPLHHQENAQDQRLETVCRYIETHYAEPITLNTVAEMIHLSPSYLSKLFTKQMGTGFNHYINYIRLEHCKADLINTNEPITHIAYKHGFTSSNMLLKYFKQDTQLTPTAYRNHYQHDTSDPSLTTNEKISQHTYLYYLSLFINANMDTVIQSPDAQKVIDVALTDQMKQLSHYDHVIQIGNLDTLLVQRFRKQLIEVKNVLGLGHVLTKDPIQTRRLISESIESDEAIPNVHPYMKIDECLNFLLAYDIGLGMEIHPPQSQANFQQYCRDLSRLLEHMYNVVSDSKQLKLVVYLNCLDSARFEKVITLFRYYFADTTVVLNVNINHTEKANLAQSLLHMHRQHINAIAFDANQNDIVDFASIENNQYNQAKKHITLQLKKLMNWLSLNHDAPLPFILLNWNTLTGDTNLTNGEYFRAGIIFEQLIEMNQQVKTIGYWLNYEIHQQYNHTDAVTQLNGIDLYHQFDGKRPAFFASMFFNRLFKRILYHNDNCIILGTHHHFQVVIWDAEHYNPYFTLDTHLSIHSHKEYQLNIDGVMPGKYKIKHLILDKNHGALYKVWQQYNTQHGMDEETIAYVNRISYPKLDISEVEVLQKLTYHLKLLTNAVHIIEFKKYINPDRATN